jgi:hypothetical protein
MLVGMGNLHLDINREGIYTGILQTVKVFYMLVGIDDLHLVIKREGIYTELLRTVEVFYMSSLLISKCSLSMPTNM